jgi:putative tributyrin esterase
MFRTIALSDPRFESDGLRCVTVKSEALRGRGDVTVWAPAHATPVALVILLHGVYGSHWCWALRGGAHRTASRLMAANHIPPVALAMPSDGLRADGTAYVRHGDGHDFERWIVHEVPQAARAALPGLDDAAPRFIAGLSMGGFGALRLGAKHAGLFHGISGHSSITHFSQMPRFIEEDPATFGTHAADASVLDAIVGAGAALPPLRFDCGTGDDLLQANRDLHAALDARGVDHTYEEFPGAHEWPYWEAHLADTLRFFARILRAPSAPAGGATGPVRPGAPGPP